MVVVGGKQIPEKRREAKGKGEKERYIHLNVEFQRIARRDKNNNNNNNNNNKTPSSVISARNIGKQQNRKD